MLARIRLVFPNARPHRLSFPAGVFLGQFRPTIARFRLVFAPLVSFRVIFARFRLPDGAMYTHWHVHEGAPLLKTLPPYRGICIFWL